MSDNSLSPSPTSVEPTSSRKRGCRRGCLISALAMLLLIGIPIGWLTIRHVQHTRQEERQAEQRRQERLAKFEAVEQKLTPAAPATPETTGNVDYDIDKTIRAIHSIDQALKQRQNFEGFLAHVMSTDTRHIAPEILASRRRIFATLKQLYANQDELETQETLWQYSREFFLTTLSLFNLNVSPIDFSFEADREQARQVLAQLQEDMDEQEALRQDIRRLEDELFTVMYDYAVTYYKYLAEWDRLCLYRDRAYLAKGHADWPTVIDNARQAIALAPYEKEAHLLLAQALIESAGESNLLEAERLLASYIDQHPESSAPAFLLLGTLKQQQDQKMPALLNFEQAATMYPRQADALASMLDPYRMRAYLRKSREGTYILQHYKSMMLGAGYFSPDLQLARLNFDDGATVEAEQKVLDHFFRRRLQKQWDFILADIDFCYDFLGTPFQQIYPESSYLDLKVAPTTFGSKLKVGVHNRSDRTLHNASLILCLHFTDMIPGDYVALQAGDTQPAIAARETTDFGTVEIAAELYGQPKSVKDIVAHRAILVSQEAVVWVDTELYRIAEAKEFREQRRRGQPPPELDIGWVQQLREEPRAVVEEMMKEVKITIVENRWGKDGVEIRLPKKLAILRPIFRLMVDDQTIAPTENVIDDDTIVLRFDKVKEYTDADLKELELVLNSPFADVLLEWLAKQSDQFELRRAEKD